MGDTWAWGPSMSMPPPSGSHAQQRGGEGSAQKQIIPCRQPKGFSRRQKQYLRNAKNVLGKIVSRKVTGPLSLLSMKGAGADLYKIDKPRRRRRSRSRSPPSKKRREKSSSRGRRRREREQQQHRKEKKTRKPRTRSKSRTVTVSRRSPEKVAAAHINLVVPQPIASLAGSGQRPQLPLVKPAVKSFTSCQIGERCFFMIPKQPTCPPPAYLLQARARPRTIAQQILMASLPPKKARPLPQKEAEIAVDLLMARPHVPKLVLPTIRPLARGQL